MSSSVVSTRKLFSGDLFFPSEFSTQFDGEQMLYPFEQFNVDISCMGNHELDLGIDVAANLISRTKSPWILTNLRDLDDNGNEKPVAGVKPYHYMKH